MEQFGEKEWTQVDEILPSPSYTRDCISDSATAPLIPVVPAAELFD
jgi:hypothetical protein